MTSCKWNSFSRLWERWRWFKNDTTSIITFVAVGSVSSLLCVCEGQGRCDKLATRLSGGVDVSTSLNAFMVPYDIFAVSSAPHELTAGLRATLALKMFVSTHPEAQTLDTVSTNMSIKLFAPLLKTWKICVVSS